MTVKLLARKVIAESLYLKLHFLKFSFLFPVQGIFYMLAGAGGEVNFNKISGGSKIQVPCSSY